MTSFWRLTGTAAWSLWLWLELSLWSSLELAAAWSPWSSFELAATVALSSLELAGTLALSLWSLLELPLSLSSGRALSSELQSHP